MYNDPLPPDRAAVLSLIIGCTLAFFLVAYITCGCSAPQGGGVDGPAVRVLSASGSGTITLEVYGHTTDAAFSERYTDGVRCTVVEHISLDGIMLGAGYLPPPLSDEGCARLWRPFRAGGASIMGEMDSSNPAGGDPDPAVDPATGAVSP